MQVIYSNIIGKKYNIQNNKVYNLNFTLENLWIHESKSYNHSKKKHIHLWVMIFYFSKSPNGWFEGDKSILFLCFFLLCFVSTPFYFMATDKRNTTERRKKKKTYCSDPYKNYTKCKLQNQVQIQNVLLFLKDTQNESSFVYLHDPYFSLFLSDSVNSNEYTHE